jgi:DNA-binding NarL/FixJ family response regulator
MNVKVALVDDHRLFREGLRTLLEHAPGFEVVAEASDANEIYRVVEQQRVDLCIVDVALPGSNGVTVARELGRRRPDCKVLMLTMHAGDEFVSQALAAGASGYALKDQSANEIIEAIRVVTRGETYLSPRISRLLLDDARRRRTDGNPPGPCDPLSAREREVFDLLVQGMSNDAIAGHLFISVKTVETHRARVLRKLGMHSIVELVRFAARHGLLYD